MTFAARSIAVFMAPLLFCGFLTAEVPPLESDELKKEADLIVTGRVTEAKIVETKLRSDGKEAVHQLVVSIGKLEKGKLKKDVKTVIVRGSSIELKKGFVGSRGHRSSNTGHSIAAVKQGWKLTLYLKGPKDGSYEILFPNGFEVIEKSSKK